MTETNVYEVLPASKEKDVESSSGLQELHTTNVESIYADTATVESEASTESYQELVASQSLNESPKDTYQELVASESLDESPGDTYQDLVASESYYENPGEVTSSSCSHGNIYENPPSTG